MVKAGKVELIAYTRRHAQLRSGFHELLRFCNRKNIEFVIVSNGFDFYIETVLHDLGLNNIKVISGKVEFNHNGLAVKYFSPTGVEMVSGFKEAYTRLYQKQGYRIIYIGNGISDVPAARLSYRIFARDDLLAHCSEAKLNCIPFDNMHDVIKGLADIDR
jgi:2-hydroxy-3-keto-5-methylthiopentenyl-1-phosphate phosphatase